MSSKQKHCPQSRGRGSQAPVRGARPRGHLAGEAGRSLVGDGTDSGLHLTGRNWGRLVSREMTLLIAVGTTDRKGAQGDMGRER